MRIAIPYENGNIAQKFGLAQKFAVYDTRDGKIVSRSVIGDSGMGRGVFSDLINYIQPDAVICGTLGQGAYDALAKEKIRIFGGAEGSADDAAKALAENALSEKNAEEFIDKNDLSCVSCGPGCGGNCGSCH